MSAIDLAHYIRERLNTLGMTTTAAADYSMIKANWLELPLHMPVVSVFRG